MSTFNNEPTGLETNPTKRRVGVGLIAGVSAAALAGTLAGCAPASSETTEPNPNSPVDTVGETTSNVLEGDALIKHFEIPAEATGKELAEIFLERESEWNMYGIRPDLASEALATSSTTEFDQLFVDIANGNSSTIPVAIFTENALTKEATQNFIANMTEINASSVKWNVKTSPEAQNPENEKPYVRKSVLDTFESSTVNPDGSETIVFTATTNINYGDNVADDLTEGGPIGPELREYTITVVPQGTSDKIDNIEMLLR